MRFSGGDFADLRLKRAELGARRLDADAAAEARDRLVVVIADPADGDPQRNERVDVRGQLAAEGQSEIRRQHADDGVGPAVEHDRPSNHAGIGAEALPPERVRQRDDVGRAVGFVGRGHGPADSGTDTEHVEE